MQVDMKRMYSCNLVRDLEKERQRVLTIAEPEVPEELKAAFLYHSKLEYVRKYCQMGVRRRWHDFFKEVRKNHILDEQGRYEEMTMPEMMSDKSSWTEEDHKVYQALMAAKDERLDRGNSNAE